MYLYSSLQGLLSWNPMMSFDNLEGNSALNKKKFMIDVLQSAVTKLYNLICSQTFQIAPLVGDNFLPFSNILRIL